MDGIQAPQTEQECIAELSDLGGNTGTAAVGLFHLYRGRGQSFLEAYISVLTDIIDIQEKKVTDVMPKT